MINNNEQIIREFLRERFGDYRDDMGLEQPLDGMVDSLAMIELVTFVENRFSISISNEEYSSEFFATIGNILETIDRFKGSEV